MAICGARRAGDPGQATQFFQCFDPRRCDHSPVADHDHAGQAELVPYRVDRGDEGGRVGGVAGEDQDRDRPPDRVGEQPVLDLQLAALTVAGVAELGQFAAGALHPRRGQVEHRDAALGEVAAGQLCLDVVLAGQ